MTPEQRAARIRELEAKKAAAGGKITVTDAQVGFTPAAETTPEQKAARIKELEAKKAAAGGVISPTAPASTPPATTPPVGPSGIQLSGESSPTPPDSPFTWPEALTPMRFSEKRMPEYEGLPMLWSAPAMRSLSGLISATPNASMDEIAKITKANNPGVEIIDAPNGYKLYKFKDDPQVYAHRPGIRMDDLARITPSVLLGLATGGASIPAQMALGAAGAAAQEYAQSKVGGSADVLPVVMAGAAPLAVPAAQGVVRGALSVAERLTAPANQTAENVAGPVVEGFRKFMSDWGANTDLADLGEKFANFMQPKVVQAETTAAEAAAARKAVEKQAAETEATAIAKATADEAAATAEAKKAAEAASLRATTAAEDTGMTIRSLTREHDAINKTKLLTAEEAAAAKEAATRAAAVAPVREATDATQQKLLDWGATEASVLDTRALAAFTAHRADLKKTAKDAYGVFRKAVPGDTLMGKPDSLKPLKDFVHEGLNNAAPENQSKLLQKVKKVLFPDDPKGGHQATITDVEILKRDASNAGKPGTWVDEDAGLGREVAKFLKAVEEEVGGSVPGAGKLLETAKKAGQKSIEYDNALKAVLPAQRARALSGSILPAVDKAGRTAQRGNLENLKKLVAATPKEMEQEVMASTLREAMLNGMPSDPEGAARHVANFMADLRNRKEVAEYVFPRLPPDAARTVAQLEKGATDALNNKAAIESAAEAERAAAVKAAREAADKNMVTLQDWRDAEKLAARREKAAALRTVMQDREAAIAAAKGQREAAIAAAKGQREAAVAPVVEQEAVAKAALDAANAANIPLARDMRTAGAALLKNDPSRYDAMMKLVPPDMKQGVAVSTLYHTLLDPAAPGAEGIGRLSAGLSRLNASPTIRKRLLEHFPNPAEAGRVLDDFEKVTRIVDRATKEGRKKLEGWMEYVAATGRWAAGSTGAKVGSAIAGAYVTGNPAAGVALGATFHVLGRAFLSKLGADAAAARTAAAEFFRSTPGKELLSRIGLDKEITGGFLNKLGQTAPARLFMKGLGVPPIEQSRWWNWLATRAPKTARVVSGAPGASKAVVRTGSAAALTPNDTKEN